MSEQSLMTDCIQNTYLNILENLKSSLLKGYNIKQILFNETYYTLLCSKAKTKLSIIKALLFNPCKITTRIGGNDILTFHTHNYREDHDLYWQKILGDLGNYDEITVLTRNRKCRLNLSSFSKKYEWYRVFYQELGVIDCKKDRSYLASMMVSRMWTLEQVKKLNVHPKLVMCYFDSSPDENVIMQYFKQQGAITVTNQHGQPLFRSFDYDRMNQSQILNFKCDYFLAKGSFTKLQFENAGFDGEKIYPVGIIKDEGFNSIFYKTNEIFGVYLDCPSFPFAENSNKNLIELAIAISQKTSYQFILKTHPTDDIAKYSYLTIEDGCIGIYGKETNLSEIFNMIDFGIIHASATYVDAIFYGLRCFKLNTEINFPIAYDEDCVSDSDELYSKVQKWNAADETFRSDYINKIRNMYDAGWKAGNIRNFLEHIIENSSDDKETHYESSSINTN